MKKILFILMLFLTAIFIFLLIIFLMNQNKDKGALQVTSAPASKVYLNGKLIGQTPLCECELKDTLSVGSYTIRLVPTTGNFEPFEQKITISSKVLTVVDRTFGQTGLASGSVISLVPIQNPKEAQISVISFPVQASVYLDSNLEGQTPILLKSVTESDHELKLGKDGYNDKTVRIRAVDGYKLEALIFLGINPQVASASAAPVASSSALTVAKVLILQTPTGFLRVRDNPSLGGSEIAQVKPGETYDFLNEQNGWYEIKLNNGQTGWISSEYAQKQ